MSTTLIIIIALAVLVPLFIFAVHKSFWKVSAADEALVITGWGVQQGADGQKTFKIVTGRGSLVLPVFQKAQYMPLSSNQATLQVEGVDSQRIKVGVRGSVVYKVGDDEVSITNAATRFLDATDARGAADISRMGEIVLEAVHGHLRSLIGGLPIEELITNRNALAGQAREATASDMQRLGLVVDSLQIQEVLDPTNYITSLSEPRTAEVKMAARIAQANRDREAQEAEQAAAQLVAAAQRDTAIQQANFRAEQDKAQAIADQAGPLAEAQARQDVVEKETQIATLEASRTQQRLLSEIQRPADAQAYRVRVEAAAKKEAAVLQAQADAEAARLAGEADAAVTRAIGEADAEAIQAKGLAEAAAIAARATALEKESSAVIQQQLAEKMPEIVAAAAGAFEHVDSFTVLNGAEGVTNAVGQIIGQAGPLMQFARDALNTATENPADHTKENGHTPVDQTYVQ